MRKFILSGACLAMAAAAISPAVAAEAAQAGAAACDAKQYGTLVGKSREEARWVRSDYRLVQAGKTPGAAKAGRVTITYDPNTNRITEVSCG